MRRIRNWNHTAEIQIGTQPAATANLDPANHAGRTRLVAITPFRHALDAKQGERSVNATTIQLP